ncbi:oligosaccharide repeat unit polymerase [Halobacillus naozhouensis]|uniref:Oligosaccharide repeat unit polymerase n=1 Tax=Halobacillus naozhouensis TaxID=554880 RepID=A0ABY8IWU9_9BACI|nr:oligosaccharide repeat unit polymerase [Halobacillus naozhouensis]WFT74302.1 oligosaccharide repeat unit polymerase [Halobacillus naozhouensis]
MKNNLAIKKKYIYIILSAILFKSILEYGYYVFVNPLYQYNGFIMVPSQIKLIESYLLVILISFFLAKLDDFNKPSKVVVYILFINLYLPISCLYWLQDEPRDFFFTISFSFIVLYLIITKTKSIKLPLLREGNKVAIFTLLGISVFVYGYLLATGGLQRINLNLLQVYETREAYSENTNTLVGYLLPWQAHVVNLFFLIFGLIKRNKGLIITTLLLQLLLFSMTNFKSFLFAPLVVVGLYYLFNKGFKNSLLLFISISLSSSMAFLIVLYRLTDNVMLLSLFLRRLFFVPAKLHYVYFEYFEGISKYKLSMNILSFVFEKPYNVGPVDLISRELYDKNLSPNVGIFGDGYLNFGLLGILIFIIILSVILILLDSVSVNSPLILSMSIIIIPSMALVNSAMFTSFVTHGILFAIFVIWMTSSLFRNDKRSVH